MNKPKPDPELSYNLQVQSLESIIERLKREIPLEGKKWQEGMIRHYSNKLAELKEAHGNRR